MSNYQNATTLLRVVGLDLSLTSSGVSDGDTTFVVRTTDADPLEERLHQIRQRVLDFVSPPEHVMMPRVREADLVVVEGAAYGARGHAVDQLAGLRLMVRTELWLRAIPFAVVTPSGLKAYTTGNGRADKREMTRAVLERHGVDFSGTTIKGGRYDMADAYALAAMGYAQLCQPLPTMGPPPRRDSLLAVTWPEGM